MKNHLSDRRLTAILFAAFFLGCAAHAVTMRATSAAQSDPSQNIYRECFATTLYSVQGHHLGQGKLPELTTIPEGWHVVGGGGNGLAVLCR